MVATWIEAAAKGRHGGPGPRGDVVSGRRRHPSDRSRPGRLAGGDGRSKFPSVLCPPTGSRTRESTASGTSRSRPKPWECGSIIALWRSHKGSETASARPRTRSCDPTCLTVRNRPRSWRSGPEGLVGNRMMTVRVDARGSTYDVYFPTVRSPLRRPAGGGGPAAEPVALSGDRRRPGRWPETGLVHRAALLGAVPALSGRDQSLDDRAHVASGPDPSPDHRLRRDGAIACRGRPAGRFRRGSISSGSGSRTKGRSLNGRSSPSTFRRRSTAGSASPD